VKVPAVPFTQLAEMPPGPSSADLLAEVLEARARHATRFGRRGAQVNGRMTPRQVRKFCPLKPDALVLVLRCLAALKGQAHTSPTPWKGSET
jgi:magnesium chelatase family protein